MLVDDEDVLQALEMYRTLVRGGMTPVQSRAMVERAFDPEVASGAVVRYQESCRRYIEMTDPRVLAGSSYIESWYAGPDYPSAWCWPSYKGVLTSRGFGKDAITSIDQSTTKIMAHLPHPGHASISHRGLVVGYVQSGKTANYTGLIAKAADAGYRLFIVLAGMTSSLRQQTQRRLTRELVEQNPENWQTLTDRTRDFYRDARNPSAVLNPDSARMRILLVVKKNTHILRRLVEFLRDAKANILSACPALVIDDEADQASVNTAERADHRTAINRHIVDLLGSLPKAAYVGYTATPFANVFIDPTLTEGLFPRDFVVSLPRNPAYFGAERLFGRSAVRGEDDTVQFDGLDMLQPVLDPDDVRMLQPPRRDARFDFEPSLPESLEQAVHYFLLATACRYARGQQSHSSMLVHTTYYVHTHQQLCELLTGVVAPLKSRVLAGEKATRDVLQDLWREEHGKVTEDDLRQDDYEVKLQQVTFNQVWKELPLVLERLQVVIDNGRLGNGLVYADLSEDDTTPAVYIAVGGNTLSRGLTLEGLVVSYFVRQASAYDTLLQMGRWFGYRRGYEDLPRAWMTEQLAKEFQHLATVEEEIRTDIAVLEQQSKSPYEFAIRVQSHPRLVPTSYLKMQNCRVTSASYSEQREQTTMFHIDDIDWLENNLKAGRRLIEMASSHEMESPRAGVSLFRGVDCDHVVRFLEEYQVVDEHTQLRTDLVLKYIEAEVERGALRLWNVGIVGRGSASTVRSVIDGTEVELGTVDLGLAEPVACINRSRFQKTWPANIKVLTSASDRVLDVETKPVSQKDEVLRQLRQLHEPDTGLLLLYPISPNSVPLRASDSGKPISRHPLAAAAPVLGLSLVFPKSRRDQREYVANDLSKVFAGAVDGTEEDEAREILTADTGTDDNAETEG